MAIRSVDWFSCQIITKGYILKVPSCLLRVGIENITGIPELHVLLVDYFLVCPPCLVHEGTVWHSGGKVGLREFPSKSFSILCGIQEIGQAREICLVCDVVRQGTCDGTGDSLKNRVPVIMFVGVV